jgi:acetylglutamate/LysW-gamma-L-alpha-aminoadipate kinase
MTILKIGGGKDINLQAIVEDIKAIDDDVIIVHGANAIRNELAEKLQTPIQTVTSVSGYSSVLSDSNIIDLQMMAYSGLRNKRLVELFQQNGVNAVGLSGIDGGVISGKRNPGIKTVVNGKRKFLRDFSGKPKSINKNLLDLLLENKYLPVLTVPILDEDGNALNSENDDIVALLNKTYEASTVIHLIEAPGFMDINNPDEKIDTLSEQDVLNWEAKASGRFKRKLNAIKKLLEDSSTRVIISDGRTEQPLTDALAGKGTIIQ